MTPYQVLAEVASFAILQGSRAHHQNVSPGTDWDFYCPNTTENESRLQCLGFVLSRNPHYLDKNTSAVYKYINDDLAIDVAIVKDMSIKARVEDWIDEHPWILTVPKYDRPMIYNMIMDSLED